MLNEQEVAKLAYAMWQLKTDPDRDEQEQDTVSDWEETIRSALDRCNQAESREYSPSWGMKMTDKEMESLVGECMDRHWESYDDFAASAPKQGAWSRTPEFKAYAKRCQMFEWELQDFRDWWARKTRCVK